MPARFYFAEKSEGLDPKVIISNMKSSPQSAESVESFSKSDDKARRSIFIYRSIKEMKRIVEGGKWVEKEVEIREEPDMAFFMMGTTDQLTRALKRASSDGIASFYIPLDTVLHIRYVRRKTTSNTKSVVGIAPLKEYWGLVTVKEPNAGNFPWIAMYTGGMASGSDFSPGGASITISDLMTKVLPKGRGMPAQY